jgi:hypothetical protein
VARLHRTHRRRSSLPLRHRRRSYSPVVLNRHFVHRGEPPPALLSVPSRQGQIPTSLL